MTDIQPNQNIKINDQTYSVEINRIQVGEYGGRKISLQPLDANGEAQGIAIKGTLNTFLSKAMESTTSSRELKALKGRAKELAEIGYEKTKENFLQNAITSIRHCIGTLHRTKILYEMDSKIAKLEKRENESKTQISNLIGSDPTAQLLAELYFEGKEHMYADQLMQAYKELPNESKKAAANLFNTAPKTKSEITAEDEQTLIPLKMLKMAAKGGNKEAAGMLKELIQYQVLNPDSRNGATTHLFGVSEDFEADFKSYEKLAPKKKFGEL